MTTLRKLWTSRFPAWIALAVMLFAASSPLVAALRFEGTPRLLAQICSLGGLKALPDQPAAPAHEDTGSLKHCVFCFSGAWQPPVAPGPAISGTRAATAAVPHPDRFEPAREHTALQPLSPRAP